MFIKSAFKILHLTTFFLLISSTALAEVRQVINCPSQNTNLNAIVALETLEDGTKRPKKINHKAYLVTKNKKFNCQIEWISLYSDEWVINCENGANISQVVLEGIYVTDRNGSTYKMESLDSKFIVTCTENEVTYQTEKTAYQQSFQFDIIIELTYERKKTPKPAGF